MAFNPLRSVVVGQRYRVTEGQWDPGFSQELILKKPVCRNCTLQNLFRGHLLKSFAGCIHVLCLYSYRLTNCSGFTWQCFGSRVWMGGRGRGMGAASVRIQKLPHGR